MSCSNERYLILFEPTHYLNWTKYTKSHRNNSDENSGGIDLFGGIQWAPRLKSSQVWSIKISFCPSWARKTTSAMIPELFGVDIHIAYFRRNSLFFLSKYPSHKASQHIEIFVLCQFFIYSWVETYYETSLPNYHRCNSNSWEVGISSEEQTIPPKIFGGIQLVRRNCIVTMSRACAV